MSRPPFRPSREGQERDLHRELAFHVECRTAEFVDRGLDPSEARRRAVVELGGLTQVQEGVRDSWTWARLDTLARDLRHAARNLRRSWGFALGAGAILAMGIGTNTAIFSVVHTVLLTPLAYPGAERIVAAETLWTNTGRTNPNVSGPDFLDWQSETGVFDRLAHFNGDDQMATTVNGRGGFGSLLRVSGDFFEVFGRPAAAGRLLNRDDNVSGQGDAATPPVVVGYEWAVANFGSANGALDKTFLLYRSPAQIVGVAAPGFHYPDETNIWIPAGPTDRANRNAANYRAVGRLKEGLSLASSQAAMRGVGDRLAAQHPGNRFKNVSLTALQEQLTGHVRGTLWMLMGAVALTLVIGCANIASLLLVRSAARAQEFALRAALGAARGHLVRQIVIESSVLTLVSGSAGLLLAHGLVQGFVAWAPIALPRVDELRIDGVVLLFACGLSIASVLLFSLIPAARASSLNLTEALKQGGTKGAVGGRSHRLRSALVVAEIAVSIMLLAGAGLLLRSFQKLNEQDLGFTTDRVVAAYTQYALGDDRTVAVRAAFFRDVLARVRALPRIKAAAGVTRLPLAQERGVSNDFFIDGQAVPQPGERLQAFSSSITPDFFKTLNVPFRAGRDFTEADTPSAQRVIIVNESLARAAFPGQPAVGRRISRNSSGPWLEIVGVVGDSRWRDPSVPARPEFYQASAQGAGGSLTVIARTSDDETAIASAVRRIVQETDPTVPVRVQTVAEMFGLALSYPRFRTQLIGVFAAIGVVLSAVGIFSMLAHLVSQRTRELAVRRAIGAAPSHVVRLVLGQGVRLVVAGVVLGIAGALLGGRLLTGVLYETSPWDVPTYIGVLGVLGLTAVLAMLLPVLRAARIDPLIALRSE
ncbi:MAG: ABC transporter permease [Acidobacteria bacterium]|nr:ABC transporter permease [Acidobacteriota bacterium]